MDYPTLCGGRDNRVPPSRGPDKGGPPKENPESHLCHAREPERIRIVCNDIALGDFRLIPLKYENRQDKRFFVFASVRKDIGRYGVRK